MSESNVSPSGLCQEVEERLSEVLDGSAPASLYDHIAECDECRDRRHEADRAASVVAGAGADFRPPVDFAERLLARVQATRPGAPAPVPPSVTMLAESRASNSPSSASVGASSSASSVASSSESIDASSRRPASDSTAQAAPTIPDEVVANEPAPSAAANVAKTSPEPALVKAPPAKPKVVSLFRRRAFAVSVVGALAAAAAVGLVVRGAHKADRTTELAQAPWTGKITSVSRASSDKTGGLEACDSGGACSIVAEGTEIRAGMTLRTDARTRAHVSLGDGTQLALDRASQVELAPRENRTARVAKGTVVADVAKVEGASPAHFVIPQGDVEVLGTKLALSASDDRASIEVARGEVRLRGRSGKAVSVRAGEEATLFRDDEPVVASTSSLADVMEWSDRSAEEVDAPVLRGLGELRARKPGQTKEREHAVRLAKHAVKVRIVDVVARTEVDETFANDTDEELEGIFRFPLPPGAQIERLALEVDGKLVEGAFVDRDRGAAIWRGVIQNAAPTAPKPKEEIVWVPGPWRDPALLEWQRGGRFELKIFPIPRRGSRRVILTYTQVVDQAAGVRRFTYPLAHDTSGTTKIDAFDLDLQVLGHDKAFGLTTRGYDLRETSSDGGGDRRTMNATSFTPAGDLSVEYALPDREREVTAWAYKADAAASPTPDATKAKTAEEKAAVDAALAISSDASPYVTIAVRPKLPRWQEARERVHVIVVDSSRSMVGERFARATRLASSIVREMDRRDTFVTLACDTVCRTMPASEGSSSRGGLSTPGAAAAGEVERFLGGVEPDGGSDLFASMQAARAAAGSLAGKELRILYLGDGTPTVGPTRAGHVETAVRSALPSGDSAVIAVALGADADVPSLQALARGGGGVVVPYVPGQKVSSAALDVLGAAYGVVMRDPEIELPAGLTQVSPARLDPIRAGGEAFIVARMSGGSDVSGTVKVKGRVAGERFEQTYPVKIVATSSAGNAFVPRLYAAAKIAELERAGGEAQKPTIIELSKRFAVASKYTSLLVLESEAMFKAFGLDRGSVAPTFTGEEQAQSSSADADGEEAEAAADAKLGDEGAGKGYGSGHGRLSGSHRESADKKTTRAEAKEDSFGSGFDAPADPDVTTDSSKNKGFGSAPAPTMAPPTTQGAPMGPMNSPFEPQGQAASPPPPPAKVPGPSGGVVAADPFRDQRWSPPRRQRMIPMKRVFDRNGGFEAVNTLARQNAAKLVVAESALATTPDSRDKTVELYALYATSGRIGEAQELTARWSGRDALDPDALAARADLAARQGERDRSIRILGGLADVRPNDRATQVRLAELQEAAGNAALACEHRIALAGIAMSDVKLVADAVRCTRALGMNELASLLRSDTTDKVREALDRQLAASVASAPVTLRGDVQITAQWTGGEDLDIALIDAQGRRISWLGSAIKAGVSVRDATSTARETLAIANLPAGSYVIEITRASGERAGAFNQGEVTLRLVNDTRKIPFSLSGARSEIGTARVFFTSRLVPVSFGF